MDDNDKMKNDADGATSSPPTSVAPDGEAAAAPRGDVLIDDAAETKAAVPAAAPVPSHAVDVTSVHGTGPTPTGHGHGDDGHHHDAGHMHDQGKLYGVLAEYDTPGALVAAAKKVRDAGYTQFDCYSSFPVHGIDEAMGIKRTILPALVFCGGIAGLLGGLVLQWWCNAHNWPWNISGKPTFSIAANIPIIFECTILLSVFTTFFGMWALNKLPQVWHPFFRLDRFARVTDDAFLLGIEAADPQFEHARTTALLHSAHALAVEDCHLDPRPESRTMPGWIYGMIISSTVFALIPFAVIAKARASKSSEPHYHIFPDMDFQQKVRSDTAFDLFPDGRGNRGEVPDSIARGSLNADDTFYRGTHKAADGSDAWTTGFPAQLDINADMVKRGQERFNIYCTPCHGYDGRGKGAVKKRVDDAKVGILNPANLVAAGGTALTMPNGQLYNTVSNGWNTMMGYAAQIPPADRWAIVLYVRALQRAQNASLDEIPENERGLQQ